MFNFFNRFKLIHICKQTKHVVCVMTPEEISFAVTVTASITIVHLVAIKNIVASEMMLKVTGSL